MAVAFATRHPAVTSAIIGPRTMEHLDTYLAADEINLSDDVLDRIGAVTADPLGGLERGGASARVNFHRRAR